MSTKICGLDWTCQFSGSWVVKYMNHHLRVVKEDEGGGWSWSVSAYPTFFRVAHGIEKKNRWRAARVAMAVAERRQRSNYPVDGKRG